jgi:hypothetical protein
MDSDGARGGVVAKAHARSRNPFGFSSEYYSKNRRADPDGIRIAAKYILDGLVEANVLPDDSQKWIIGFVDRFDVDRDDPRIEVELMPEPDAL